MRISGFFVELCRRDPRVSLVTTIIAINNQTIIIAK